MLTEPFLQFPTNNSVNVVWLTNFKGKSHSVVYGEGRTRRRARATTAKMERMLEDGRSTTPALEGLDISEVVRRPVYRHEAVCAGLNPDARVPYFVRSIDDNGKVHFSGPFTLQPIPSEGTPLKILLTSDQQNRQMSPAGFQKAAETAGKFDMVLVSGDYVDVPRRASEWFDRYDPNWLNNPGNPGGRAFPSTRPCFFPSLQGTYQDVFPEFPYTGGEIMQHAVTMGGIGNHEVPGRYRPNQTVVLNGSNRTADLNFMDSDPQPRWFAELRYEEVASTVNPENDPEVREQWLRDNSQDFDVHRELWTHPEGPEGESYYSIKYGDVYIIVMHVSRIWRTWNIRPQDRGKFTEIDNDANFPEEWGFGDFNTIPFDENSPQFAWLQGIFASDEYQNSKYKVLLAHHTVAGLGDNGAPVHAVPVMEIDYLDENEVLQERVVVFPDDPEARKTTYQNEVAPLLGSIQDIRYEYPLTQDVWRRDVEPLLIDNGVQLVHIGHSHLWNRTKEGSLNYLETSNYGNTFNAFWTQPDGTPWRNRQRGFGGLFNSPELYDLENYPRTGDPHGREPIFPTLANPMQLFEGEENPVPFVSSNNVTVFTYIDTAMGMVRSFAFDTRNPEGDVIEFDRFPLIDTP